MIIITTSLGLLHIELERFRYGCVALEIITVELATLCICVKNIMIHYECPCKIGKI